MTPEEEAMLAWYRNYGSVHEVKADPRGTHWVSGYIQEITATWMDQIKKAERRGYEKGLKARPKGGDGEVSSQRERSTRKSQAKKSRTTSKA